MHNQHHCLLILSYDVNGELPVNKANVLEFCVLNFDVNLPWQGVASGKVAMKFISPCSVYYWNPCCVLIIKNIFGEFLM